MQIARSGQMAPGGKGQFIFFDYGVGLNTAGQMAFIAVLPNTGGSSGYDRDLFFFDNLLGLLSVAREGELFLGSVVTEITGGSGLNELGQMPYQFKLADGRSGIAIATPPDINDLTPGDTDFDGDIDLVDLGTLATYCGQSDSVFGWVNGDFDNDNDVDLNDLGTLATNYDRGASQAYSDFQALTSVPEPAVGIMLLAGLGHIRMRRR